MIFLTFSLNFLTFLLDFSCFFFLIVLLFLTFTFLLNFLTFPLDFSYFSLKFLTFLSIFLLSLIFSQFSLFFLSQFTYKTSHFSCLSVLLPSRLLHSITSHFYHLFTVLFNALFKPNPSFAFRCGRTLKLYSWRRAALWWVL